MWGTWWEWTDSRLVSMLFQLFLLLRGVISLRSALEDSETAAKACALLSIVGCINVVIIKYSVEWWNTLHQVCQSCHSGCKQPERASEFWIATLIMIVAVYLFLSVSLILSTRNEILERERRVPVGSGLGVEEARQRQRRLQSDVSKDGRCRMQYSFQAGPNLSTWVVTGSTYGRSMRCSQYSRRC